MNKKTIRIIITICMCLAALLIFQTTSNAATLSISTSKSSVAPGETFTVTVTLNDAAGPISATTSGGTGSASQWLENSSLSFSCTAGSSGSVTITASGTVGDFATETDISIGKTKSVSIIQPTPEPAPTPEPEPTPAPSNNTSNNTKPNTNTSTPTVKKSSNSNLESLQIAESVFSPEFAKNVYEYAVIVPNEITKLNIAASQEHSRATVKVVGNEELQVGDNTVEIIVTAEDGSTSTYKIYATRALPELSLATLGISYINENNEKVNIVLEPQFIGNIYEYKINERLSHTIKKLQIEATANRENAKIELSGNEDLKAGKNEITIKVTLPNEAGLEEQKIYTIVLEREEEPVVVPLTTTQKIKNWFSGIGATVGNWAHTNFNQIITGMLLFATVAFVGLTIYLAVDYKNYQKLLSKLAEYNMDNLKERANAALNPEMANNIKEENSENVENIEKIEENNNMPESEDQIEKYEKPAKGRRFK
jgi:hypothetical protein